MNTVLKTWWDDLERCSWFKQFVNEDVFSGSACSSQVKQHQLFILFHVTSSLLSLSLIPIYLVIAGRLGLIQAIAFFWLVSPLGIAVYLSLSGSYKYASFLSLANLVGALTFGTVLTGGWKSPFLFFFCIPFFQSFLIREGYRFSLRSLAFFMLGGATLFLFEDAIRDSFSSLPQEQILFLVIPPIITGFLSSVGMLPVFFSDSEKNVHSSVGAALGGTSWIINEAADLLTVHSLDGRVSYVSNASFRLFGVSPESLKHDGMFESVHPADQVRFLKAIAQSVSALHPVWVVYRIYSNHSRGEKRSLSDSKFIWVESSCRSRTLSGSNTPLQVPDIILVTRIASKHQTMTDANREVTIPQELDRRNKKKKSPSLTSGLAQSEGEVMFAFTNLSFLSSDQSDRDKVISDQKHADVGDNAEARAVSCYIQGIKDIFSQKDFIPLIPPEVNYMVKRAKANVSCSDQRI